MERRWPLEETVGRTGWRGKRLQTNAAGPRAAAQRIERSHRQIPSTKDQLSPRARAVYESPGPRSRGPEDLRKWPACEPNGRQTRGNHRPRPSFAVEGAPRFPLLRRWPDASRDPRDYSGLRLIDLR